MHPPRDIGRQIWRVSMRMLLASSLVLVAITSVVQADGPTAIGGRSAGRVKLTDEQMDQIKAGQTIILSCGNASPCNTVFQGDASGNWVVLDTFGNTVVLQNNSGGRIVLNDFSGGNIVLTNSSGATVLSLRQNQLGTGRGQVFFFRQ
jgi:hypothetical protein